MISTQNADMMSGMISDHSVFLRSSICTYTRYQGTRPPEISIVRKTKNVKNLACGK
ncbi:hypothetical protein D3C75_1315020 [compost metagenome]